MQYFKNGRVKDLIWNRLMRLSALTIAASFCLAITVWSPFVAAQNDRDFVFTDEDGHLVLRFAGTGSGDLDATQKDEIVNAEFSTMVHDRIRADLRFEAEPVDSEWAAAMEPRLERLASHTGLEISAIDVECRSASCRLVLEHLNRWSISEHRALMGSVQNILAAFIEANSTDFGPVFLMTAYDQASYTPHIKAILPRVAGQN